MRLDPMRYIGPVKMGDVTVSRYRWGPGPGAVVRTRRPVTVRFYEEFYE
jgi:hypothetical protein